VVLVVVQDSEVVRIITLSDLTRWLRWWTVDAGRAEPFRWGPC
jgi:hypothetical protein